MQKNVAESADKNISAAICVPFLRESAGDFFNPNNF
jgi:hypothetical protein